MHAVRHSAHTQPDAPATRPSFRPTLSSAFSSTRRRSSYTTSRLECGIKWIVDIFSGSCLTVTLAVLVAFPTFPFLLPALFLPHHVPLRFFSFTLPGFKSISRRITPHKNWRAGCSFARGSEKCCRCICTTNFRDGISRPYIRERKN
jgi:hypothetical protein